MLVLHNGEYMLVCPHILPECFSMKCAVKKIATNEERNKKVNAALNHASKDAWRE